MSQSHPPERAVLSVSQFCDVVGIGRTMFYERVKLGQINVLKIGARSLVPVGQVQAFLVRAGAGQL